MDSAAFSSLSWLSCSHLALGPLQAKQQHTCSSACTRQSDASLLTVAVHLRRLYDHAKKVANKLEAARAAQAHPKDDATGAPFFAPVVGRAPTYARNHAALPIGDYLYGMRCAPLLMLPPALCREQLPHTG